MQRLIAELSTSSRLSSAVPPGADGKSKVVVNVAYAVTAVSELKKIGYIDLVGMLTLQWQDQRLSFNPSDYSNITIVQLQPDLGFWTPDIELYNALNPGMRVLNLHQPRAVVFSSGSVLQVSLVSTRSSCDIFGQLTAKNSQVKCTLKFTSRSRSFPEYAHDLEVNEQSDISSFVDSGRWTVLSVQTKRQEMTYSCCPEVYPSAEFTFTVQARQK